MNWLKKWLNPTLPDGRINTYVQRRRQLPFFAGLTALGTITFMFVYAFIYGNLN